MTDSPVNHAKCDGDDPQTVQSHVIAFLMALHSLREMAEETPMDVWVLQHAIEVLGIAESHTEFAAVLAEIGTAAKVMAEAIAKMEAHAKSISDTLQAVAVKSGMTVVDMREPDAEQKLRKVVGIKTPDGGVIGEQSMPELSEPTFALTQEPGLPGYTHAVINDPFTVCGATTTRKWPKSRGRVTAEAAIAQPRICPNCVVRLKEPANA